MKKLQLFWLLSFTVFLAWCFGSENSDIAPSQPTSSWEITITSWDTVMSWWVDTWVINTGIQESIQSTKDIVWTTMPKDKDIELFLIDYLSKKWFNNYKMEKIISKGNITAATMMKQEYIWNNFSCEQFWSSSCINFIMKDDNIIRTNLNECERTTTSTWWAGRWDCIRQSLLWSPIAATNEWDWLVYRFTNHGVLFKSSASNEDGCIKWSADWFTYVNLDSLKKIYSVLSKQERQDWWINREYGRCFANPDSNAKWNITSETLVFFSSKDDREVHQKSLPIQAKTTEEAFYKYYKLPQPKN
jgi:hypothetical protein